MVDIIINSNTYNYIYIKQIEILAGLIQNSMSKMNNNGIIISNKNINSSKNSNGKRSNSDGSSRKTKRPRKTNSNNFNNDIDLSLGARKLFEDLVKIILA